MLNEPGALIRRMFRDLDPWSDARFPFADRGKPSTAVPWMPPVELSEHDHRLTIKVDLPAVERDTIGLSLTGAGLVIEGERTHEAGRTSDEFFRTERTYGHFYRVVPVPGGVDYREVKATFKNGVLEITMPVPAAAAKAPYRVPVDGQSEVKIVRVAA